MGMSPFTGSTAVTEDKLLGTAYKVVKKVHDNLDTIEDAASMVDDFHQVANSLDGVEGSAQAFANAAETSAQEAAASAILADASADLAATSAAQAATYDAGYAASLAQVEAAVLDATADIQSLADQAIALGSEISDAAAEAEASANSAASSATSAGNHLTAIQALTTGLYADTTAGLAAVASGEYFAVADTSGDRIQIYKDNAGVAEHQFDLPSDATVEALLDAVDFGSGSTDILAITDNQEQVAMVIDGKGRIIDADGRDIIGELRAAAYATTPVAVANAGPALKFSVDKAASQGGDPIMWDRRIWSPGDSAGTNFVRMPSGAFLGTSDVAHVFACEKSGDVNNNAGGENGMRAAWRPVTFDFDEQTVELGSINVLYQPSGWASYWGFEGTFSVHRIENGTHKGVIEVFWCHGTPEDASYNTPGSTIDIRYATSLDNYATKTTIVPSATVFSTYPTLTAPTTQAGAAVTPNATVEFPAGHANEGRRVTALYAITTGGYPPFTIYADKNVLFSAGTQFGSLIDLSGTVVVNHNETALSLSEDKVRLYKRIEDAGGGNLLTHPGFLYSESLTGHNGWSAAEYRDEAPFGNVQLAVSHVDDGANRTIIGASTAAKAGIRNEFKYGIAYDGKTIVALADPGMPTAVRGYGHMVPHVDSKGRLWIVHFYEEAEGLIGFNHYSHIRVRVFNLPWLLSQAEPV